MLTLSSLSRVFRPSMIGDFKLLVLNLRCLGSIMEYSNVVFMTTFVSSRKLGRCGEKRTGEGFVSRSIKAQKLNSTLLSRY